MTIDFIRGVRKPRLSYGLSENNEKEVVQWMTVEYSRGYP